MRNVVYLTDENYAMATCVSMMSLIYNNQSNAEYKIYVIQNNVSEEAGSKFLELENEYTHIELINVQNEKYADIAATCLAKGIHVSETALFKFDIPNLLPNVDKVLYLDGDIIVNKDLTELFDEDISEYYLAAVDDMGDKFFADGRSKQAFQIGIEDRAYFNSGVMYLNLELLRQNNITEMLIDYRVNKKNFFMDQDALNAVLGHKRKKMDYKYNFLTVTLDTMKLEKISIQFHQKIYKSVDDCLANQVIIHMADKRKPWKYNIPWISELFFFYYKLSGYSKQRIELKSYTHSFYEEWMGYINTLRDERNRKIWGFPFHLVPKGSKVVLYGAGNVGQDMYQQIEETGYCDVVLWVDRKWQELSEEIVSPEKIKSAEYDYIVIAISRQDILGDIKGSLIADGILEDKMICCK